MTGIRSQPSTIGNLSYIHNNEEPRTCLVAFVTLPEERKTHKQMALILSNQRREEDLRPRVNIVSFGEVEYSITMRSMA